MAKENRLKEQLDKLKEQVSTLEKKWEVEDTHHTATVGVSEENRSRNQFALMESEENGCKKAKNVVYNEVLLNW